MKIAFYGSSLLSSYWNGAATYYRGILHELAKLGFEITFLEPDAYDRQAHRDIEPPEWARVVVYPATPDGLTDAFAYAHHADIVVKASGVGVYDDELACGLFGQQQDARVRVFWDVDAPATLAEMEAPNHPLRAVIPRVDLVLTYGGGAPVVERYRGFGAMRCVPIYNALTPETHHPVPPDPRFAASLSFLGNRLPDREKRVDEFFFAAAHRLGDERFLIGGAGWESRGLPPNVRHIGHVPTCDHNAFNTTPRAVLNISRDSMALNGFSPATRVFEACGAGACLITDAWEGVSQFLEPGEEVLVAHDGEEVADILRTLTPERARTIGDAGRRRVLRDHTYAERAKIAASVLREAVERRRADSTREIA